MSEWAKMAQYKRGNIGQHLGFPVEVDSEQLQVVGIDVDHYDDNGKRKVGGDQLADLETVHGPLPPTWVSTARAENGDWISGIRFFLVPRGLAFQGQAAADIEVIQKNHRYAVVWPSFNPKTGTNYRLYSPTEWANQGEATEDIPDVAMLPMLPAKWLDYLTHGGMRDEGQPIDMDCTPDEVDEWAEATFRDGDDICRDMAKAADCWVEQIQTEATSHDKILYAHWNLYRLATEGHTGWRAAIAQVNDVWIADVIAREKRSASELRSEIFRSRMNALRKIKAEPGARQYGRASHICLYAMEPARRELVGKTMVLRDSDGDVATVISIRGRHSGDSADSLRERSQRNAPLDLRKLRTEPPTPISWLLPDVLPRGSYVSISAAPGTGKSILSRAIAVSASLGYSAFDPSCAVEPAKVI